MSRESHARVWFYYARGRQVGPMPLRNIREAIADGSLTPEDYVYRDGFRDWKQVNEVPEILELAKGAAASSDLDSTTDVSQGDNHEERRIEARAAIHELVVAHNDTKIAKGNIVDISATGLFLQTDTMCFSINEEIKVTLKEGKGLGRPLNIRGVIVRQANDSRHGQGYGLEIRNIDEKTRHRIIDYVKRNQAS